MWYIYDSWHVIKVVDQTFLEREENHSGDKLYDIDRYQFILGAWLNRYVISIWRLTNNRGGFLDDILSCFLTHWGLVTPYGDSDLGQPWLR